MDTTKEKKKKWQTASSSSCHRSPWNFSKVCRWLKENGATIRTYSVVL